MVKLARYGTVTTLTVIMFNLFIMFTTYSIKMLLNLNILIFSK